MEPGPHLLGRCPLLCCISGLEIAPYDPEWTVYRWPCRVTDGAGVQCGGGAFSFPTTSPSPPREQMEKLWLIAGKCRLF